MDLNHQPPPRKSGQKCSNGRGTQRPKDSIRATVTKDEKASKTGHPAAFLLAFSICTGSAFKNVRRLSNVSSPVCEIISKLTGD